MTVGRPRATMVPSHMADPILQEVMVRAEAKKKVRRRTIDPALGTTPEEADENLELMRGDINAYGAYVYDKQPAYFHRYWNSAVDDVIHRRIPQNKILIIAPPNTAKSTWNAIIRATHYIGNHPDRHIITVTSSDDNAREFDGVIARTLEESDKFKTVFPDNRCRPYKKLGWSSDGRYLRGVPEGDRNPTYKAVGLSASIMGNRSDGIILDDPMDQKTAQSETEQRKAKAYVDQTIIPRLQPNTGWLLAIMTRFHEFDLASHFIKLAAESGDWLYIRTPMIAEENDPVGRAVGELLWPEWLNQAYVDREWERLTLGVFNMIHQGDPTGTGGDLFKDEKQFQELPDRFWSTIFPDCKIIVISDLAFSDAKKACYTVIMTIAIDVNLNMYLIHVYRQQRTQNAVTRDLINIIKVAKPLLVAVETDNFHQERTTKIVRDVLSKVMCNITMERPKEDKYSRAMLPASRVEHGKFFVDKRQPWYPVFAMECLGFPNTRYKDQVDTLSLASHVIDKIEQHIQIERPEEPIEEIEYVA